MQEMVNESALDNITKEYMLDTIDNLICCIRGSNEDILELVNRRLERMDEYELEAYYRVHELEYYQNNLEEFQDDFYWEFLEE